MRLTLAVVFLMFVLSGCMWAVIYAALAVSVLGAEASDTLTLTLASVLSLVVHGGCWLTIRQSGYVCGMQAKTSKKEGKINASGSN